MIVPLLLSIDFRNFTYSTNPCPKNVPVAAVVRKGRFSYMDKATAAGFDIYVDSVKEGTLKPGTRQAVVVMECEFPVGGTAAAYAFDERQTHAVLLRQVGTANWGPDWGAGPSSITIRFAENRLHVEDCADDDCTAKRETTYALKRNKLVQISVRTKKTR